MNASEFNRRVDEVLLPIEQAVDGSAGPGQCKCMGVGEALLTVPGPACGSRAGGKVSP